MSGTGFVSEESFNKGRELEARLVNMPKDLGILFASVLPSPVEGGKCWHFTVVVGVIRNRQKETILPIVAAEFSKEKADGSYFTFEVVRGTKGAAAYEALPGPPTPSTQS